VVVDLPGDIALQTPHDVELGQALVGPPLDIGPGWWVAVHGDQGDAPQGVVGLAVAAAVEAVAVGAARGRRDRGDATQLGEGRLATQPLGVVAGGDQQLAGGVDPDPGQRDQGGGGRGDQDLELVVELGELGLELLPAAGQVRRAALVAAVEVVSGPGRMATHARTRALVLSPSSGARSASGAL
jgi:hypothetical protein